MNISYRNPEISESQLLWDLKKKLDQETNFMMYEPLERTYDEESVNQI